MDQNGFLRQMTDWPDRQTKVPPHLYTQTMLGNQLWNSDMYYLVSAVYRNPFFLSGPFFLSILFS